jgi:peptide subunit release factor RF-3
MQSNLPPGSEFAENSEGELVVLFKNDWALSYFIEKNPTIKLSELPFRNGNNS